MKDLVEQAERQRLEGLNRRNRERGLIRAVHDLEGRSLLDQGRQEKIQRDGKQTWLAPQGVHKEKVVRLDLIDLAKMYQSAFDLAKAQSGASTEPLRIDPKEQYLSKKAAARHLDIGERTLTDWMREHRVIYHKIGRTVRFKISDLDKAMSKFRYDVVVR